MKIAAVLAVSITVACLAHTGLSAQNQQQEKPKSVEEMAAEQADLLGERLGLEYWQVFYVDSILTANFKGMEEDIKRLGESRVSMESIYFEVQDRWAEKTDSAFMKLFNEEQWKKYMSSGARKAKKERDRRAKERMQSKLELQERMGEGKL